MPDAITVSDSLQTRWTDIPKQEQQEHPSHLTLSPCFEKLLLPLPIVAPILSISTTWCSLGVWPQPPAHTCDPGEFLTVTCRALAMPSQSQVGQHSESVASTPCHLCSAIAVTSREKKNQQRQEAVLKSREVRLKRFRSKTLVHVPFESLLLFQPAWVPAAESVLQAEEQKCSCLLLSFGQTMDGDGSENIAEFGVNMQSSAARHAQRSLPRYSTSGTIPSAAGLLLERLYRSSFFP